MSKFKCQKKPIMKPTISIIAAIGKNRELGKDNSLLWYLPKDLPRFKKITLNHPIIMGRKTYESIGRVLPNRLNIIVTRNKDFTVEGALVVHALEAAIQKAKAVDKSEIFIIGGAEIFKSALPLAERLYLTVVHESAPADVFFPPYADFTQVIHREDGEGEGHKYTFMVLEKLVHTRTDG